tara:strand:+ start:1052 stop:1225 length:174 start_codon:yes stop_codon:yes gene_type:complete
MANIGGDKANIDCSNCGETNTTFEEYGDSSSDISALGIVCEDCDYEETPYELNGRYE